MKSAELNELFAALAKAQSEMRVAGKDSNNPFFKSKYADLASVVAASRPVLTKNGLCVMQSIHVSEQGQRTLVTILGHSSGQYISSTVEIKPLKEDMQSLGSAITYMRRYSYASLVGVIADDEDDDGETAMKPYRANGYYKQESNGANDSYEKISKDQLEMLDRALLGKEGWVESILKHCSCKTLADIPKDKFLAIYDRVVKNEAK
jgi:hypothetical protein